MRPMPPKEFEEIRAYGIFRADKAIWPWCLDAFLNADSPLYNEDHLHLMDAKMGFLWTDTPNSSKGRAIIGQAEDLMFRCGKWQKGRQEQQIYEWFGCMPDFLITLDANYCMQCSDVEFLALIEHELLHCGQATDEFGMPKFNRETGLPVFAMRGHDVEEFVSIVKRYGVVSESVADLVIAAAQKPLIGQVEIAKCCGTCLS